MSNFATISITLVNMSMNFISSTDIEQKKIFEFNISFAQSGRDKDLKKIIDDLIFQRDISCGKIYLQAQTEDYWLVNNEEAIARLLDKNQFNLILEWNQKDLLISNEQFEILSSIGGLPSHEYSLEPKSVNFPVAIKNTEGQLIDLCILHLSEAPPSQRYFKKCVLLDEVKEFYKSELALSHELRLSSMLADEIRMGFYPFTVRTKTGQLITYNGSTQFASNGDLKGEEIVAEEKFHFGTFGKVQDVPSDSVTYIIGKWDDRIETLYQQYSSLLKIRYSETKTSPSVTIKKAWWQRLLGI